MDLGIAGRWALVGGASKGLGFGCAQALVREGVHVVVVARGGPALEAAAAQLRTSAQAGAQVLALACDITTVAGRETIFGKRADFDIVVTNAGGPPPGDFRTWDRQAWIQAVDANMLTPIELIKATVDGMPSVDAPRVDLNQFCRLRCRSAQKQFIRDSTLPFCMKDLWHRCALAV